MSRCFPFPPPGFEKKHDALIESIKLQKERERAKKERKKEKREKKEKSRDKSSCSADKTNKKRPRDEKLSCSEDKKNKKSLRADKSQYDKQGSKTREEENEQLERSSLTEEHGMPSVRYRCDSPDSSQSSCKRTKHNEIDFSKNTQGCGFRIKLPLHKQATEPFAVIEPPCMPVLQRNGNASRSPAQQRQSLSLSKQKDTSKCTPQQGQSLSLSKQKETSVHVPALPRQSMAFPKQKETALHAPAQPQQCLSLFKQMRSPINSLAQQCQYSALPESKETELSAADGRPPCLSEAKQDGSGLSTALELPCFSGRTDTNRPEEKLNTLLDEFTSLESYRGSSRSRRKEAKFNDLFLNWNPEPCRLELPGDEEWLFEGRWQHQNNDVLAGRDECNLLDGGSVVPSWPPQACLLPEAGVYALPFVLPF